MEPIDPLKFYTTQIDKKRRAVLSNYLRTCCYCRGEDGKFKKQDELILYKSKQLSIKQTFEHVRLANGTYDDKAVLVIKRLN